ncbi:hypothetical protein [Rubripirellula reticaptiva]|uniref:Uncharacterized protein n=1 Tax=Rubripirellula reticaptiva TaxID=2528013 RepID=A0A5C6F4Y8_9BACT|nr:hypothetical protein [Rubripirellula reticaptiva]TWU56265.1 hypothetical protein Poly59_25690 [Rubripirellula reticaptiva]
MNFDLCIGVDYSGAKTPVTRSKTLQVYASHRGEEPSRVSSPSSSDKSSRNWCRREIACWLADQVNQGNRIIAGIDHGFSFPISYFERYGLESWPQFLADFVEYWPTDQDHVHVSEVRGHNNSFESKRTGTNKEFRLTERWSSSAKSVFQFDVQGSVAMSTHAGIPWLHQLKSELADRIHFWPFDGWDPPEDKSVIAEIYPSIFKNRYPRLDRTCDQQDAYSVAKWLSETSRSGFLNRYFNPPLNDKERTCAELEGWILGIS